MFAGLKSLLASKKFWSTVIGSGLVSSTTAALYALHVPSELVLSVSGMIAGLFGIQIGAQGYADGNKKP
jgi:hypothetical protein